MEHQSTKKLQHQAISDYGLGLVINELVKLYFVEQFVFEHLPITSIPAAVKNYWDFHIFKVKNTPEIFLKISGVPPFTHVKLKEQNSLMLIFQVSKLINKCF